MALKDMKSNLAKGAGTPDEVAKLRGKNVMEIALSIIAQLVSETYKK